MRLNFVDTNSPYCVCYSAGVRTMYLYGQSIHVKLATNDDYYEDAEFIHFSSNVEMQQYIEQANKRIVLIDLTEWYNHTQNIVYRDEFC